MPTMASENLNLLHYLSMENPVLDIGPCHSGSNTRSGKTSWDLPRRIQDWADFEYQSLDSIYNGALRDVLRSQSNLHRPDHVDRDSRRIYSEEDMTHVVVLWNKKIVSKGLKIARNKIGNYLPHGKIYMCQGKHAQAPSNVPRLVDPESRGKKKNQKPRSPDWAGSKCSTVNPNDPKVKAKNLLPGDTKVSKKWKSATIVTGDVKKADVEDKNWLQPVGQIYTYCVRSNARYGYLITDKELVVFRIRSVPQIDPPQEEATQKDLRELAPDITANLRDLDFIEGAPEATQALTNGVMEYKAIPWDCCVPISQTETEVMTVNMALWWLHMMAAQSSAIGEDYVTLADAVWDTDPGNKTPGYPVVETDSQETEPLQETSFNSQRSFTSFESELGGSKREKDSQNCVASFQSDLGRRKRPRDDDGDAEMPYMPSPSKRSARGRKPGPK